MKTPLITKVGILVDSEKQANHFYLDCFSTSYRLITYGSNKSIIRNNLHEYAEISGLFFDPSEPCVWITKIHILNRGNIEYSLLDPFYINSCTAMMALQN